MTKMALPDIGMIPLAGMMYVRFPLHHTIFYTPFIIIDLRASTGNIPKRTLHCYNNEIVW